MEQHLSREAELIKSSNIIEYSRVCVPLLELTCLHLPMSSFGMTALAGSILPVAAGIPARRTARPVARRPIALKASSNNEVVESKAVESKAPFEPTVFYGGSSYTESEVTIPLCC